MRQEFFKQTRDQAFDLLQSLLAWSADHPRRVLLSVGAVLLGTGATAFAVATLAPTNEAVQVRMVTEPLAVSPALGSSGAQSLLSPMTAVAAPVTLYRSDITRANDSADSLLRRLGVRDAQAASFIKSDKALLGALIGRAGRSVSVQTDGRQNLQMLKLRWAQDDSANFQRLVIERNPLASGFNARFETAALQASTRVASGVIRSSLFAATDEARLPDSVAVQLAEIFASDIDFIRDLRKGDRFHVTYEALEADGEPLRAGRVLSAEFVNGGTRHEAVWFQEPGLKGQYYTLAGNSLRKAFLASPLEFSRITSGFGGRVHPLAKQWRVHKGVDYAAPTGTAVRSVGDGVVDFAGVQRGYGNVIEVQHRDGKKTVYAHLSKIHVRKGQKIEQGDLVGAVGSTGWSTGPHLHFEFRVAGVHHDPLTIAKEPGTIPLSAASRPAFERVAAQVRREWQAARSITVARAQ